MRRALTVFLLLFLPVQFVWAGIGTYVAQETGTTSFHYGAHAHPHDPRVVVDAHLDHDTRTAAPVWREAAVVHDSQPARHPAHEPGCTCGDCDACGHDAHAHFVAVPGKDATPSWFTPSHGFMLSAQARLHAAPPARPERPNWRLPA